MSHIRALICREVQEEAFRVAGMYLTASKDFDNL